MMTNLHSRGCPYLGMPQIIFKESPKGQIKCIFIFNNVLFKLIKKYQTYLKIIEDFIMKILMKIKKRTIAL